MKYTKQTVKPGAGMRAVCQKFARGGALLALCAVVPACSSEDSETGSSPENPAVGGAMGGVPMPGPANPGAGAQSSMGGSPAGEVPNDNPAVPPGMGGSQASGGMPPTEDPMAGEGGAAQDPMMPGPDEPTPPVGDGSKSCAASFGAVGKELTDPTCDDGKYCEQLPDNTKDIKGLLDDLRDSNDAQKTGDLIFQILDEVYPFGSTILRSASPTCLDMMINAGLGGSNFGLIDFAVHECGHFWDLVLAGGGQAKAYHVSPGVDIPMSPTDYFHRSELTQDKFHNEIPNGAANGTYFDVGATTSAQGIQTMFDEWLQYTHNMVLMYAFSKAVPGSGGSNVATAMNFAWAAPRYLLWGKQNHPEDFAAMMADPDVRKSILTIWGQTMLFWDANLSAGWTPSAGEMKYLEAIRNPELLEIMNELRKEHGCSGL